MDKTMLPLPTLHEESDAMTGSSCTSTNQWCLRKKRAISASYVAWVPCAMLLVLAGCSGHTTVTLEGANLRDAWSRTARVVSEYAAEDIYVEHRPLGEWGPTLRKYARGWDRTKGYICVIVTDKDASWLKQCVVREFLEARVAEKRQVVVVTIKVRMLYGWYDFRDRDLEEKIANEIIHAVTPPELAAPEKAKDGVVPGTIVPNSRKPEVKGSHAAAGRARGTLTDFRNGQQDSDQGSRGPGH